MIYIVADDLTGATDTGVKLSKLGHRVEVIIRNTTSKYNKLIKMDRFTDVLVIDSETRELSIKEAREMMINFLDNFSINDDDIIYKKVDSTMRGNIGCEIEKIIDKLNKNICIFTPALPSNNRVVIGGYLLVRNKPLGVSEYYNGGLNKGRASYIPYILEQQTNLPVGLVELKDIINGKKSILEKIKKLYDQGKKIIVLDAISEEDLKNIVESSIEFEKSTLFAGSAGLAKYLFKSSNPIVNGEINDIRQQDTFLIVGGSRNNILDKQIEYLKENLAISDIKINIPDIILAREKNIQKYINTAKEGLSKSPYLIIRPDPIYKDSKNIENLLKRQFSFRDLEITIRGFLSELSAALINNCQINSLIITGGDTAKGICEVLGINSLQIKDELLPGIPISLVDSDQYKYLKLVTKAGGFGENDTLYELIRKLKNCKKN